MPDIPRPTPEDMERDPANTYEFWLTWSYANDNAVCTWIRRTVAAEADRARFRALLERWLEMKVLLELAEAGVAFWELVGDTREALGHE